MVVHTKANFSLALSNDKVLWSFDPSATLISVPTFEWLYTILYPFY